MYSSITRTKIYVSQKYGNNDWGGLYPEITPDGKGPVKDIERALVIIARLRCYDASQPISVVLLDDVYSITTPIQINKTHEGITFESECGTVISGGVKVEGFNDDVYFGTPCLSADVSEIVNGGNFFTDFYVNGKMARYTRFPESGYLGALDVEDNTKVYNASSKWFIADKETAEKIASFKNLDDCIISYCHLWVDEHTRIESCDPKTGKIVMERPSRYSINDYLPQYSLSYIVENVAECLKNPGEWYLDRETKKVYYVPFEGETKDNISAFVPVANKLIEIKGEADEPIRNFHLKNLTFAHTKGEYMKDNTQAQPSFFVSDCLDKDDPIGGFAGDVQAAVALHGAIEYKYARSCYIESCIIECIGTYAIRADEGCTNLRFENNRIRQCGAGGIMAGGGDHKSPISEHTYGIQIKNNEIMSCGIRHKSAVGIILKHAYRNVVSHNTICDLNYTGISVGWVWGYAESISCENLVEYNHIYDIGHGLISDMAGIYTVGRQPGTIFRNNLIHDVERRHYGGWGIYTDEGSTSILVENNICYNCNDAGYMQHFGKVNVLRNNIFCGGVTSTIQMAGYPGDMGLIIDTNILVCNKAPAAFHTYIVDVDPYDTRNHISLYFTTHNNLYYNIGDKKLNIVSGSEGNFDIAGMQERYGIDHKSTEADPMFVDFENHDFRLKENSPALKMGFKQIDMSDVGAKL